MEEIYGSGADYYFMSLQRGCFIRACDHNYTSDQRIESTGIINDRWTQIRFHELISIVIESVSHRPYWVYSDSFVDTTEWSEEVSSQILLLLDCSLINPNLWCTDYPLLALFITKIYQQLKVKRIYFHSM